MIFKIQFMMNKIKQLLEYQLNTSINNTKNDYNISSSDLHTFISTIIISKDININLNSNITDSNNLDKQNIIKRNLYELLDNVPDFIHFNKTLTTMTQNFILICKKKNINTENITEELVNCLLIEYIENTI